jgi:cytoskeletal protein CcmA (bactofilin family)
MFSTKNGRASSKLETVIGKDFSYKGVMEAVSGSLRIDGYYEGELTIGGDLIIGETGCVYGTISAKNVTVAGQIRGSIEARGKLELAPSAKVVADTKMAFIVIEEGAFFQGTCEPLARDPQEHVKPVAVDSEEENSNLRAERS